MDSETENLGFARVDVGRFRRQGVAEVVYGEGKSAPQIAEILFALDERGQSPVLVTRIDADKAREVKARFGERFAYFEEARLGRLGDSRLDDGLGTVAVVCGGTSDLPVAEEAALTLEALGNRVRRIYDVGVAGIHRLLVQGDRRGAGRRCRRGNGRGAAERGRRARLGARGRRADERRLRRVLWRRRRAARDAELVRGGRQRGQHRQRVWRGVPCQPDQPYRSE